MFRSLVLAAILASAAGAANAGRIVVNHDEWTLSNTGYSNAGAANADRFAKNVANFLTGGATGNILVATGNFGLTQSSFLTSLSGYSVTVNGALPLNAANLAGFDAVFLGGDYPSVAETADLISYVNGGGGIYIMGGTGVLGAGGEAAAWNAILNGFGLSLAPTYNGVGGTFASAYAHPIFTGVSQLYYNNGNSVSDLAPADPNQAVYGPGYFGIYDFEIEQEVPAPAALALFGLGIAGIALRRRG